MYISGEGYRHLTRGCLTNADVQQLVEKGDLPTTNSVCMAINTGDTQGRACLCRTDYCNKATPLVASLTILIITALCQIGLQY